MTQSICLPSEFIWINDKISFSCLSDVGKWWNMYLRTWNKWKHWLETIRRNDKAKNLKTINDWSSSDFSFFFTDFSLSLIYDKARKGRGKAPWTISVTRVQTKMKLLVSISSTFYACIFHMKFWCQKLQSCILGLKFFCAKYQWKRCV